MIPAIFKHILRAATTTTTMACRSFSFLPSFPTHTQQQQQRTATIIKATAAPILAKRMVKMTPGKSGSSAVISASVMGRCCCDDDDDASAGGVGGSGTAVGPVEAAGADGSSANHAGVLGSAMML